MLDPNDLGLNPRRLIDRQNKSRLNWFTRIPASAFILIFIFFFFFVGQLLSPFGSNVLDSNNPLALPSAAHWLGTDELGRDSLTRLMLGGRLTMIVVMGAVLISLLIGTAWGILAAIRGGWIDEIAMRLADISMSIPQILFALLCIAAFGPSLISLTVVAGLLLSPSSARMARTAILQEKSQDYFTAAIAYGANTYRLITFEVLPNALPAIMSQAVINAASAIILEASLSFVGLGVQPPEISLGSLLQQGYGQIFSSPLYAICPAVTILIIVLCMNFLADRLVGAKK